MTEQEWKEYKKKLKRADKIRMSKKEKRYLLTLSAVTIVVLMFLRVTWSVLYKNNRVQFWIVLIVAILLFITDMFFLFKIVRRNNREISEMMKK